VAHKKVAYSQLEVGYEIPPASFKLDSATVADYIRAVGETSDIYRKTGLVPPLAVAAQAMAALADDIELMPGTIHISQEFEFMVPVTVSDTITSHAKVSRKQSRGKFNLLAIDMNVLNQKGEMVLTGKTSFMLPELNRDKQP